MIRTPSGRSAFDDLAKRGFRDVVGVMEDADRNVVLPSAPVDRRGESPLRILLVEDNPGDARLVREALAGSNAHRFELVRCDRLRDGLRHFESSVFDLVLLDLGLPDSIGLQTLIRAHTASPTIPIIVLTGNHDEELGISAVRMGAQDYLVKGTFDSNLLVRSMYYAIERARTLDTLSRVARENNRLASAITNVTTGVFIIDPELPGNPIIFVNPAFLAITGYSTEEVLGRNWRLPQGSGADQSMLDAIDLAMARRHPFSGVLHGFRKDGTAFWSDLTISPVHDAEGDLINFVGLQTDVTQRVREEETQRFLTKASEVLAASLDYEATLENVAQLIVPTLADWCITCVRHEDGTLQRVSVAHSDPAKLSLIGELPSCDWIPSGSSVNSVLSVLETGQPQYLFRVADQDLIDHVRDNQHLATLRQLNLKSMMIVPLIARGRAFGVVVFAMAESGRHYGPADLALAEDLTRRAALAVDNAWLYREAQLAAERSRQAAARVEALSEASRLFAEAGLDFPSLMNTIAQHVAHLIGDHCSVLLLSEDRSVFSQHSFYHRDPEALAYLRSLMTGLIQRSDEGLNGLVIRSGQPLLIPDVDPAEIKELAIPAYWAFVERYGVKSILAVPLRVRGRVIGTLFSARDQDGASYTLEDQGFLQDLADRVALAIDNTGLYQQLLERERQLQDLVGRLLVAQEEERRRVAYEVHDELAQIAASAHQHLQAYSRYHRPRSPEAREQLDRAVELAQRTVRETRRVVANLRPTTLDDFGLAAAIRLQIEELQAQGWQIGYQVTIGDDRLPPAVETALFRVAQEALTNVRKHARTTEARVVLERVGRVIRLEIRDAGRGFDRAAVQSGGGAGERVGLPGMQERVALLGGRCTIESWIGRGTTVTALVPVLAGHESELAPPGVSPA